jgi:RNA polymerase sigma-70 factor (ECF subfamily)
MARRLAPSDADANDLTQDTMLRAYRSFDTYTSGTNARAWLLTILYSVFVNDYQRARRVPTSVPIEELEERYGIELADPSEPADLEADGWSEPEVETALAELPDAFRAAVLLVDVEELTYEEAARALDCKVGTVRSRLFRARRLLAVRLERFARARGIGQRGGGVR